MQAGRRQVDRLYRLSNLLAVICSVVAILLFVFLFRDAYYALCAILICCAMIPFLLSFEKRKPKAGELAVVAVMTSLAIAGRAAFFMLPQVKPMTAIVVITGAALGKRDGFMAGAMAVFVSNFMFGQGIWTPFQMFGLGLAGFLAGCFFDDGSMEPNRWMLAIFGFLAAFIIYGMIADMSSVLFLTGGTSWTGILAVYAAGVPFNLLHGCVTSIFLFLFGRPLLGILQRLDLKYNFLKQKGENNDE